MPAPTDIYCTEDDVKTELGITDSVDDDRITRIVHAVSRQIDDYVGADIQPLGQTRYYRATGPWTVDTDPFTTLTSVAYDSAGDWSTYTVISTGYASPFNAANKGKAYTQVILSPLSSNLFPMHERGVRVIATFGYGATAPLVVKEACIMQSSLVYRQQVSGGAPITGGAEFSGPIIQAGLHPMVRRMLEPYRHGGGLGAA
jgi:hypothetical protein